MNSSKKVDSKDVGLQLGWILGKYLLETDHLHYGYWPEDLKVELANVAQAQKNYSDFLFSHIPEGIHSVLDVGCGTGANAERFIKEGYQVDCVSPSAFLTKRTLERVGDKCEMFECFFEDIETDKKYDMIFFSESFQYVKIEKSLDKCMKLLNKNGYILICDFFKIPGEGVSTMGGGHKLAKFNETIAKYPLEKLVDIDITDKTSPNIQLVHEFLTSVAMPAKDIVFDAFKEKHSFIYRIVTSIAMLFFGKKLRKLNSKYFCGDRNKETFERFKTYRFFLYRRKPEND